MRFTEPRSEKLADEPLYIAFQSGQVAEHRRVRLRRPDCSIALPTAQRAGDPRAWQMGALPTTGAMRHTIGTSPFTADRAPPLRGR